VCNIPYLEDDNERVLKRFMKSDQEMIHDIIDMKLLDIDEPIYIRKGERNDESTII